MRYINVQLLLLSPICPHICGHLWNQINNELHPKMSDESNIIEILQLESSIKCKTFINKDAIKAINDGKIYIICKQIMYDKKQSKIIPKSNVNIIKNQTKF